MRSLSEQQLLLTLVDLAIILVFSGAEVDLRILRAEIRPGTLAAAGAIIPSLAAGTVFSWLVLHKGAPYGFFLGIVLSVTADSLAANVLLGGVALLRRYAQV